MKKYLFPLLLLTLSGCADYFSAKPKNAAGEHNTTQSVPTQENVSLEQARVAYKQQAISPLHKQKNMVHIVRQANGTSIDFWIDLYNDDVKIDYEFDNSQAPAPLPASRVSVNKIVSQSHIKADTTQQVNILQLYLSSYEKAQKLTYSKKYSKALVAINQALALSRNIEQGWKLKGSILYKLGNKVGAKKAWEKALKINPYAQDVKKSLASLKR